MANPSTPPLKAGMDGVAGFNAGRSASILALPAKCIVGSARDAKVFVVENGVLKCALSDSIYRRFCCGAFGLKAGRTVVTVSDRSARRELT
ncbi:MAG: hypothetical protein IPO07_28605 [Haliscomenobacter sp.]|nr:hypothetical protein [Haliscomenobacter sp.]MBK9492310.1 hypothetical protein [Haliscomenobacter sp.]